VVGAAHGPEADGVSIMGFDSEQDYQRLALVGPLDRNGAQQRLSVPDQWPRDAASAQRLQCPTPKYMRGAHCLGGDSILNRVGSRGDLGVTFGCIGVR
jgi:hypothetical protein